MKSQAGAAAAAQSTEAALSMDGIQRRIQSGISKARELGVAVNIAVVDGGAYLLHFVRMDAALLGSIDLAVQKAKTAVLFRTDTGTLGARSQPGGPLWSIENSNGGLVTFGGGVPIFDENKNCIGAVGVSGGTIEQDEQIARSCL
jgi:uncharacterized protein GlcG (DUF336 family)